MYNRELNGGLVFPFLLSSQDELEKVMLYIQSMSRKHTIRNTVRTTVRTANPVTMQ